MVHLRQQLCETLHGADGEATLERIPHFNVPFFFFLQKADSAWVSVGVAISVYEDQEPSHADHRGCIYPSIFFSSSLHLQDTKLYVITLLNRHTDVHEEMELSIFFKV